VDYVIEQAIVTALDAARKSIHIAMFSFDDRELGEAVIRAHRRGVEVRVLLDEGQGNGVWGEYPKLVAAGIPVLVEHAPGLMHHKFAVIDRRIVITGSYDWTEAANERNFENVVIIECPGIARAYVNEFNQLWAELRAGRIP
jgi:phosphatidylserine/phosphatidylglycerophosphate/cardiolipin synthase-like enzyme